MGLILQDCMYLLNSLNGCVIAFTNRFANQATHELAKVVVCLSDLGEWSCTHFLEFKNEIICLKKKLLN